MCIYVRHMPLCGHPPPTLLSYASCTAVLTQLLRITEPAAWTPAALDTVPFDLPDDCDPRPGNIWTLYADDYCGWECRNNALLVRAAAAAELDCPGPGGLLPAYMPGDQGGQCVALGAGGCFGGGMQDRKEAMVLGMPDARYGPGSERLGIGWRSV